MVHCLRNPTCKFFSSFQLGKFRRARATWCLACCCCCFFCSAAFFVHNNWCVVHTSQRLVCKRVPHTLKRYFTHIKTILKWVKCWIADSKHVNCVIFTIRTNKMTEEWVKWWRKQPKQTYRRGKKMGMRHQHIFIVVVFVLYDFTFSAFNNTDFDFFHCLSVCVLCLVLC